MPKPVKVPTDYSLAAQRLLTVYKQIEKDTRPEDWTEEALAKIRELSTLLINAPARIGKVASS